MSTAMRSWLEGFVNRPEFLARYRYYAAVLARLDPIEDPFVDVMAVSAHGSRFYLHVNVDFFLRPNHFPYVPGVLLHEVHHIVLGHLGHEKFANPAHRDLMELAMEVSANEFIREPLPGHPPLWQHYSQHGLAAGQSTLERYDLLVKAREKGEVITLGQCVDTHLLSGVGGVRRITGPADPGMWVRVKRLIQEAVQTAGDQPGGLLAGREPGRLLEELPDTDQEPWAPLDWKTALRMFVQHVRKPRSTYIRPNRRFRDQVGVIPGRIYHPSESEPTTLLVAIDTSGSMSTEELVEIARQLRSLGRLVRVIVVECDTVIHRVYRFSGVLKDVAGRGGTDLRPPFNAELLREHRPDGVVYFTDGLGPFLEEAPRVRTLWVLTKSMSFPCPWGQKTFLRP